MQNVMETPSYPANFANAHDYFGIHPVQGGWVYREWAPEAQRMCFTGEFNGWNREQHPMMPLGNGCWVVYLPGKDTLWEGCQVETLMEGRESRHIQWQIGTPWANRT